jgi:hypothetical protein
MLIWQTFERKKVGQTEDGFAGDSTVLLLYSYTVYFYKHAAFVQEIFVVKYYAA